MNPGEIIITGQLLAAIPIALLAGLISFASPCVLPVVPGYIGMLGAVSATKGTDPAAPAGGAGAPQPGPAHPAAVEPARGRVALGAVLFVLGFSTIYVLSGALFGQLGEWLLRMQWLITRALGIVVIVMGAIFIGVSGPWQRTARIARNPAGLIGAPVLGAIFALGWAPCIGPTLVAIQTLSFDQASAWRGAILAFFYCLGLGIPFVLAAVFWSSATGWIGWLRRNIRTINIIGGCILILIGLFMVFGVWQWFLSYVGSILPGYVAPL